MAVTSDPTLARSTLVDGVNGPSGMMGNQSQIQEWYQKYLGRPASQQEINSQMGNPGGLAAVQQLIASSPEASAYTAKQTPGQGTALTATTPPSGGDAAALWDAIASKAGIKDAGDGSGFADRAYWVAHPSEILNGRYAADVAGTGSDQPTGTPGQGPWQNSGKNATTPLDGNLGNDTRTQAVPDPSLVPPTETTIHPGATTTLQPTATAMPNQPTIEDLMKQSQGFFDDQSNQSRQALLNGLQ